MATRVISSGTTLTAAQAIVDAVVASDDPRVIVVMGDQAWSGSLTITDADKVHLYGVACYITQGNSAVSTIVVTDSTDCLISDISVSGGVNAVVTYGGSGNIVNVSLESGTGVSSVVDAGYPDPTLWLDASLGVTSSDGAVSSWECQSVSGREFTASGELMPTLVSSAIGGMPAISFGGAQRLTLTDVPLSSDGNTIMCVVQFSADNTNHQAIIYQGLPSAADRHSYLLRRHSTYSYVPRWYARNTGIRTATGSTTLAAATPYILTMATEGNPYLDAAIRVNGTADTVDQSAGVYSLGQVTGATTTLIGAALVSDAEVYPLSGYVAAVMAWDEVLTSTQIASAEAYLSRRYGVEV